MVTQHKLLKKPERDTQNNMPVALKKIKLGVSYSTSFFIIGLILLNRF